MELQSAYIRIFGAAAAALDELTALGGQVVVPEVVRAKDILRRAIADTELDTALDSSPTSTKTPPSRAGNPDE